MDTFDLMKKAVLFHGHSCPGLALGVLAANYILENGNEFSIDEELVAVVENDNCSVDALQALLGTTFGKGNFKFHDYGKNVFTFYNRTSKKAVRVSLKSKDAWSRDMTRDDTVEMILRSNPEDIFDIREIEFNPPDEASIHDSIDCENCGEATMSTRIREHDKKKLCIPCSHSIT